MNIDFELYRIFYEVANYGNITKASMHLNISQPAISKSIKNLENQLGGSLFIRTKKGVVLTEEGKELYYYIKQAIEFINNGENKFTDLINLKTGCIKIGTSTTIAKEFLLPYLEIFHEKYPSIDIKIITGISNELISKLKYGLIDILFLNLNNDSYESDLKIAKCKIVNDCFVVGEKYKDLKDKIITMKEINNYPLILQAKGSNTRKFLDDFMKDNNVLLKPSIELTSYSLVVDLTKIGFGIGYVTKEYAKKLLDSELLYEIKTDIKIPSRYIGYVLSKNHIPSFSTKKLIEIINDNNNLNIKKWTI